METLPSPDPCARCTDLSALYTAAVLDHDAAASLAALFTAVVHTVDDHGARVGGRARCATCRQYLLLLRKDSGGRELDLTGWRRDAAPHFSAHVLADRAEASRTIPAPRAAVAAAAYGR